MNFFLSLYFSITIYIFLYHTHFTLACFFLFQQLVLATIFRNEILFHSEQIRIWQKRKTKKWNKKKQIHKTMRYRIMVCTNFIGFIRSCWIACLNRMNEERRARERFSFSGLQVISSWLKSVLKTITSCFANTTHRQLYCYMCMCLCVYILCMHSLHYTEISIHWDLNT